MAGQTPDPPGPPKNRATRSPPPVSPRSTPSTTIHTRRRSNHHIPKETFMNRMMLVAALILTASSIGARAADNELTDKEKQDGWILMFDGKSVEGWMCGAKP